MWSLILLAFSPEIPGLLSSAGGQFFVEPVRFYASRDTCRFQFTLVLPGEPDTYRFTLHLDERSLPWTRTLTSPHEFFVEPVQVHLPQGTRSLLFQVETSRFRDSLPYTARCPELPENPTPSSLLLLQADGKPNPLHRTSWLHDTLHFYLEVYASRPETVTVFTFILDSASAIRAETAFRVPLGGFRTPIRGSLPLHSLTASGRHVLQVILQTSSGRKTLRSLFTYEAAPLSDTLMEALAYFLPDELRREFRALNRTQRVFFLRRHLSFLSPDVFATFRERLDYVMTHFREPGKPPYLTDRGRIYLVFGPPDRRLFYSELRNFPPQEHWIYYKPAMAFVFIDMSRSGNYQLAYSTEPQIQVTPGLDRYVYDEEGLLPKRTP